LIGEAAKNQATINPSQTLFDVKRLIGRRFKDSTVQKDIKLLPFEIVDKGRLTEEQIEKMIKEAEQFADEDKKVKERVDAKNSFDGYVHSMRSATEGSGDNKGLSEKMDSDEKEKILDALKDGQSWLDSNPEADAEEIKEKHKEIEGICAPIVSKYYGGGAGGGGGGDEEEEDEAHDEL